MQFYWEMKTAKHTDALPAAPQLAATFVSNKTLFKTLQY